jgi:hypothetical protein
MSMNPAPRMTWRSLGWEVTVPAGTYFLGDPCYAVPKEDWMQLLATCGSFEDTPVGEVAGHQVLAFGTRWGDGTYTDTDGHPYSVDAGLIGLVPEALYAGRERHDLDDLGRVVTFSQPQECADDTTGLLVFGNVKIDTDPEPEEEGEDDWHEDGGD